MRKSSRTSLQTDQRRFESRSNQYGTDFERCHRTVRSHLLLLTKRSATLICSRTLLAQVLDELHGDALSQRSSGIPAICVPAVTRKRSLSRCRCVTGGDQTISSSSPNPWASHWPRQVSPRKQTSDVQHRNRSITPAMVGLASVLSRLFASLRPRMGLTALTATSVEPDSGIYVMDPADHRRNSRKSQS